MKRYCLKIQSKNEKSLKNFLHFLFKHLKTKFAIIKKPSRIQNNQKRITFLKSPHVNKTAQEHFELHIIAKKILVKGFYLEKPLIFFKKVLTKLFQDISICLELITDKKENEKNNLFLFSPDNVRLLKKKSLKKNYKRSKQKTLSKNYSTQTSSLFYLPKLLSRISVFGETSVISFLEQ